MREVIVTAGPRAAGKTTFCRKVLAINPPMVQVSRDEIITEIFGKAPLDPYSGYLLRVHEKMWEVVEKALSLQDVKIILDTWNGQSSERRAILKKLRELGADSVVAWYFITPVEKVCEWFWRKPGIAKLCDWKARQGENLSFYGEESPRHDHGLFHQLALGIDSDGFDDVVRINPVFAYKLYEQTSLKF